MYVVVPRVQLTSPSLYCVVQSLRVVPGNAGDFNTVLKHVLHENGTYRCALYAPVRNKSSGRNPVVLANCRYLYWWANERDSLEAFQLEQDAHKEARPDVNHKKCDKCHCKLPRGLELVWIISPKKMHTFWSGVHWKGKKQGGSRVPKRQCHHCTHKKLLKEAPVRMQYPTSICTV